MKGQINFIGLVVKDRIKVAGEINAILSSYGDSILARMGFPHSEKGVNLISLIVEGPAGQIEEMTGRLAKLSGVTVKSV